MGGPLANPDGATIMIPTLEMSVDMLKRQISQDFFIVKQLKIGINARPAFDAALGNVVPFKLGKLVDSESQNGDGQRRKFVNFDFTESLKSLKIENGDTVWILKME